MYGSLTILPPSCFEFLCTLISSLNLHVQNWKFSPIFSSTSFLKFIFNFILSCFFLYLKVYANEAERKQWRHERFAYKNTYLTSVLKSLIFVLNVIFRDFQIGLSTANACFALLIRDFRSASVPSFTSTILPGYVNRSTVSISCLSILIIGFGDSPVVINFVFFIPIFMPTCRAVLLRFIVLFFRCILVLDVRKMSFAKSVASSCVVSVHRIPVWLSFVLSFVIQSSTVKNSNGDSMHPYLTPDCTANEGVRLSLWRTLHVKSL